MNIDINKKYKTTSGNSVKIYEIVEGQKYNVLGAYFNGYWQPENWNINGCRNEYLDSTDLNLVEICEPKIGDTVLAWDYANQFCKVGKFINENHCPDSRKYLVEIFEVVAHKVCISTYQFNHISPLLLNNN